MGEITDFGLAILVVAAILAAAVLSNKLSERVPLPAPALFLPAAAGPVPVWPAIGRAISILGVERVAVVALILILFDGGVRIGWRRFRAAAVPISVLGIAGTFITPALIMLTRGHPFAFSR